MKHALLQGRVDLEQDRIGGKSPYLLGAKQVADIIRAVTVGTSGRIGRRQEDELYEAELVEKTNNFLNLLVRGFSVLDRLIEGKQGAEDARATSLLGSTTVLRALAGAYHQLVADFSDDEIRDYFELLDPWMKASAEKDNPWLTTGFFTVGATAPAGRADPALGRVRPSRDPLFAGCPRRAHRPGHRPLSTSADAVRRWSPSWTCSMLSSPPARSSTSCSTTSTSIAARRSTTGSQPIPVASGSIFCPTTRAG